MGKKKGKMKAKAKRAEAKAGKSKARTARDEMMPAAEAMGPEAKTARAIVRRAAHRSVVGAWDLHSHSVFSDGSCTVDELISQARAAGLSRIAITDHDCLLQLSYIRTRAREVGFPVLAGTEISCRDPKTGRNVHILAFGLEASRDGDGPVDRIVTDTLYQRSANTLWQAWTLQRMGAEFSGKHVSLDEVVATAGTSFGVYKQHVMEALTGRHHEDPDYRFFYQCRFKGDSPANHDIRYPDPVSVVRAIGEQGGVAVLAHPGQMSSWASVPDLVAAGLAGIEAFHPDHGPVDEELAFEAAARHGLFVTGGSDYHGKYGEPAALGQDFIMPEEAGARVDELFAREEQLG